PRRLFRSPKPLFQRLERFEPLGRTQLGQAGATQEDGEVIAREAEVDRFPLTHPPAGRALHLVQHGRDPSGSDHAISRPASKPPRLSAGCGSGTIHARTSSTPRVSATTAWPTSWMAGSPGLALIGPPCVHGRIVQGAPPRLRSRNFQRRRGAPRGGGLPARPLASSAKRSSEPIR